MKQVSLSDVIREAARCELTPDQFKLGWLVERTKSGLPFLTATDWISFILCWLHDAVVTVKTKPGRVTLLIECPKVPQVSFQGIVRGFVGSWGPLGIDFILEFKTK